MIFKRVRTTKTKKMANDYENNTVWQLLISIQYKIQERKSYGKLC